MPGYHFVPQGSMTDNQYIHSFARQIRRDFVSNGWKWYCFATNYRRKVPNIREIERMTRYLVADLRARDISYFYVASGRIKVTRIPRLVSNGKPDFQLTLEDL